MSASLLTVITTTILICTNYIFPNVNLDEQLIVLKLKFNKKFNILCGRYDNNGKGPKSKFYFVL